LRRSRNESRVARKGGWRRLGSRGRFRYVDSRDRRVTDPEQLARIDALRIPPAWRDVWISPRPRAKLQATGVDAAGRKQYLYHPDFRAEQEEAKFNRLILFAERLPELRCAMSEHMEHDPLSRERVSAIAVRLINLGWFRIGSEQYAKTSRALGIATLRKGHVSVRGKRIALRYRTKRRALVRTAVVDAELADAIKDLIQCPGGSRLFRFRANGDLVNLTSTKLNEYIKAYMGPEFSAKDFRTGAARSSPQLPSPRIRRQRRRRRRAA
jgi:DNA topoisomerase-1